MISWASHQTIQTSTTSGTSKTSSERQSSSTRKARMGDLGRPHKTLEAAHVELRSGIAELCESPHGRAKADVSLKNIGFATGLLNFFCSRNLPTRRVLSNVTQTSHELPSLLVSGSRSAELHIETESIGRSRFVHSTMLCCGIAARPKFELDEGFLSCGSLGNNDCGVVQRC
jgi:hypothetical protein